MEDLTPIQVVAELDKYIVGQQAAKRAVAVALRNRYRRRLLDEDLRDEVIPKNILMIGPTGVGKTEIARRLANLSNAPFIKVEATKFTEVGYVGRDVDSMVRDLVQVAVRMVEGEKLADVQEAAVKRANHRIVDILQPIHRKSRKDEVKDSAAMIRETFGSLFGTPPAQQPSADVEQVEQDDLQIEKQREEREKRIRARILDQIQSGVRDKDDIEIEVEQRETPFLQVFSPQGMEEMGMMDLQNAFGSLMNRGKKKRTVTIGEARNIFAQEEASAMVDHDVVVREAIQRAEQNGIIFVDELDKIAGRESGHGPDVSREGVQRDLLPIIEGSTVATKFGSIRTNHILFIAAGAFHISRPSDLIPELQGRLPIRVELESLTEADFKRILTEPRNALIRQYTALLATEGVTLDFTPDSIDEISRIAAMVNQRSENIGARRLHTVMERLLEDISFTAPDMDEKYLKIDAAFVRQKLENISKDEDLSRYIL